MGLWNLPRSLADSEPFPLASLRTRFCENFLCPNSNNHSCQSCWISTAATTQDHRRDTVRTKGSPPESNTIKSQTRAKNIYMQPHAPLSSQTEHTNSQAHHQPHAGLYTVAPPTNQPTHPAAGRQSHHRSIDRPGCTSGPETPPPGTDSIFPFETKHGQPSNPPAGRPSDRPPSSATTRVVQAATHLRRPRVSANLRSDPAKRRTWLLRISA